MVCCCAPNFEVKSFALCTVPSSVPLSFLHAMVKQTIAINSEEIRLNFFMSVKFKLLCDSNRYQEA
ncbi:hypothetical protein D3C85_1350410 [compost metagenome]